MTTVAAIIALALKDIGMVGEGQTASGETMSDAFDTLNQMIGLWQADKLYVYAQKKIVVALTGAESYTVGAGGDVNVARPHKIDSAVWRSGGVDYPVTGLNSLEDYQRIGVKGMAGSPCSVCYVATFPLGRLYVYPHGAAGELQLTTRVDLPQYIGETDDISFPPEYELAIRYSLAEHLSSVFQTPLRPDIASMATRTRKIIKRNNVRIPLAQMPDALTRSRGCAWLG